MESQAVFQAKIHAKLFLLNSVPVGAGEVGPVDNDGERVLAHALTVHRAAHLEQLCKISIDVKTWHHCITSITIGANTVMYGFHIYG